MVSLWITLRYVSGLSREMKFVTFCKKQNLCYRKKSHACLSVAFLFNKAGGLSWQCKTNNLFIYKKNQKLACFLLRHGIMVLQPKKEDKKMAMSIRLPEDLDRQLTNLSLHTKRSKNFYIRFALSELFREIRETKEAEKVLEDIEVGNISTTPLAEIIERYENAERKGVAG